ncbi:hypothetical protein [Micrococcoides hystricis]|uniref:Phage holin family protein n=1 Tax=Micrococcoides hystricis TaxID=1572761 RepID=A0ABV6PB96_9MICC
MSSSQDRPALAAGQSVRQKWRANNTILFTAMMVIFLVALIFAASENDLIGWLVVIVAGGWLILAAVVAITVNRGAKAVSNKLKGVQADALAARQRTGGAPVEVVGETDPVRDMKLDHSFKIVQVQVGVVEGELAKGAEGDQDMINRALETIQITAANARDMIKDDDSGTGNTVTGEIID